MAYNIYNPYYPAAYNPYNVYSYQPQYQQTPPIVQQSAQQGVQANLPTSPSSLIWVRNQNEAAMYPVAPNNAVALWDSSAPSIYLKQADASGKPSMKVYDLVERTAQQENATSENTTKTAEYATKDELSAIVGVVRGLDGIVSSIKSDIEKMSGDLYGIAGKKKTAKRSVEEED